MKKMSRPISRREDALALLNIALAHEWAVSLEYLIHAYSLPKGKYFYADPIMAQRLDVRGQTIQIGIDEMYHALQLGTVIVQMGGDPAFATDEVVRYPNVIQNLKRDKMTEDLVTALYQESRFREGRFPKVRNMALNISADEVRHSRQFQAMIEALEGRGHGDDRLLAANPDVDAREDVGLVHEIMVMENELMHRYLHSVILFSGHQDLSQRLFKNSIDTMRHWDKNAGLLIKMGTVLRVENAVKGKAGEEISRKPMPASYRGRTRRDALKTLLPSELKLISAYERLIAMVPPGDSRDQLSAQLALKREHVFTQEALLRNAEAIPGLDAPGG